MAPDPHPHASLTIETVLQVCFRLLVALALAAIVAGAFLLLALAAENPTEINPTLQAIDDPQDPTAQYILGHKYAYGRGKLKDYAKALKWFRRAADQGHPTAQAWLGIMYAQGRGVPQNLAKALKWYRRAADQGHPEAQHNLALMYATGTGLAQDLAQARTWLRKAADQGFILAQVRLAATYQHGYGTPPNFVKAHAWYNLAATHGNQAGAAGLRNNLETQMTADQIAQAQALAAELRQRIEAAKTAKTR